MGKNRSPFETGQVVLRLGCVDWWGSVVMKEGDLDESEKLLNEVQFYTRKIIEWCSGGLGPSQKAAAIHTILSVITLPRFCFFAHFFFFSEFISAHLATFSGTDSGRC